MNISTTMTTLPTEQEIRNQMSLMAWVMAFLCGWVMFISAHVMGAEHTSKQSPDKTTAVTSTARQ